VQPTEIAVPLAKSLAHPFLRYRFAVLFFLLLGLVLIPPYFRDQAGLSEVNRGLLTVATIWALSAVATSRAAFFLALALLLPTVLSTWLGYVLEASENLALFDNFTNLFYFGVICFYLSVYVYRSQRISAQVLFAAMSLYMMLAVLWASIYTNLELYYDTAFHFYGATQAEAGIEGEDLKSYMMYYSFVTLSTLGYGDITPQHIVARNWAAVEAMMGQFFIAIVIARLVSLYTIERQHQLGQGPDA
jgi:hypothetical protein